MSARQEHMMTSLLFRRNNDDVIMRSWCKSIQWQS